MKVYIMNWDGKRERMVAAKSKAAAAKKLGTTPYQFKGYGSETGNSKDIAVAMSNPDVIFEKSFCGHDEWKPVEPSPVIGL